MSTQHLYELFHHSTYHCPPSESNSDSDPLSLVEAPRPYLALGTMPLHRDPSCATLHKHACYCYIVQIVSYTTSKPGAPWTARPPAHTSGAGIKGTYEAQQHQSTTIPACQGTHSHRELHRHAASYYHDVSFRPCMHCSRAGL